MSRVVSEGPDFAYATLAQLYQYGAPLAVLSRNGATDADRMAAIIAASRTVDGYAKRQGLVPLASYGVDVAQRVCQIAAYELLSGRIGFNPGAGSDAQYALRNANALAWLLQWGRGEVSPDVVYATSPNRYVQPTVYSKPLRGW